MPAELKETLDLGPETKEALNGSWFLLETVCGLCRVRAESAAETPDREILMHIDTARVWASVSAGRADAQG